VIDNDDNLPIGLMIMRGNNTLEGANEAKKDYKMTMGLVLKRHLWLLCLSLG